MEDISEIEHEPTRAKKKRKDEDTVKSERTIILILFVFFTLCTTHLLCNNLIVICIAYFDAILCSRKHFCLNFFGGGGVGTDSGIFVMLLFLFSPAGGSLERILLGAHLLPMLSLRSDALKGGQTFRSLSAYC